MEIKTVNKTELEKVIGIEPKDVFQRLVDVDVDKYDVLIESGIIELGDILELNKEIIEHMEYVNQYLNLLNINKIYTRFILEDLKDGIKYPEFDIVVYLNNIMTIQRYKALYKVVKCDSSLDERKTLYTKLESFSHSKEISSYLSNMNKAINKCK